MTKPTRFPIDGVILLDKAIGNSSHTVLKQVQRLLNAEKAGHTGTLDPFASGLLPVMLGFATKCSQWLLNADKKYRATLHLGQTTTTGDCTGDVRETWKGKPLPKIHIIETIQKFTGPQLQTPPMYSALKFQGKPLYEYARKGIDIPRTPRAIDIHSIDIESIQWPEVVIHVHCSKGTYIRTLAVDIGQKLGCGAHLSALRRTAIAHLSIEQATPMQMLTAAHLQDITCLDPNMQSIPLEDAVARRFVQGQRIPINQITPSISFELEALDHPYLLRWLCSHQHHKTQPILGIGRIIQGVLHPLDINPSVQSEILSNKISN